MIKKQIIINKILMKFRNKDPHHLSSYGGTGEDALKVRGIQDDFDSKQVYDFKSLEKAQQKLNIHHNLDFREL